LLEGGGVRLLDFGLARLKNAAPLTAAGTVMGSPSFMAPEAWNGLSDLMDRRADVYSLGVILFLILAGDLPFGGATLREKFLSTTTGERPSLLKVRPDLPRDADAWVARALARDREQRFADVHALWKAFLAVFRLEPPSRGKRESLWAAAKGAVQKLTGRSEPAPRAEPVASSNEPSFTRDTLARSVFRPQEPDSAAQVETTIELEDDELERVGPPPRKQPSPPPVEKTLSMSERDLVLDPAPDFGSGSTKSGKR
jgi:serine/threonine protein kinase